MDGEAKIVADQMRPVETLTLFAVLPVGSSVWYLVDSENHLIGRFQTWKALESWCAEMGYNVRVKR